MNFCSKLLWKYMRKKSNAGNLKILKNHRIDCSKVSKIVNFKLMLNFFWSKTEEKKTLFKWMAKLKHESSRIYCSEKISFVMLQTTCVLVFDANTHICVLTKRRTRKIDRAFFFMHSKLKHLIQLFEIDKW